MGIQKNTTANIQKKPESIDKDMMKY